jgi:hypothetical protein
MWNSPKVGEWIEGKTAKVLTQKKQRGWEYMRKLGNSPKVPRPPHKKAKRSPAGGSVALENFAKEE